MNFEKKYWSKGEFTTADGKKINGFVGVSKNKAYNFITEEELLDRDTYLARINCSSENFDRTLSNKLKLPFDKRDITFAANDFLYSSSVKTAIDRLQANNDYIFRHSIISNSILPYTSDCVLLSSPIRKKDDNNFEINSDLKGYLSKFNFSSYGLSTKTHEDNAFYPDTVEKYSYFVAMPAGNSASLCNDSIIFDNGTHDTPIFDIDNNEVYEEQELLKKRWELTYNGGQEVYDGSIWGTNELEKFTYILDDKENKEFKESNPLLKTNYSWSLLTGDKKFFEKSKEYYSISLSPPQISAIGKVDKDILNFTLNSICFIFKTNSRDSIPQLIIGGNSITGEIKEIQQEIFLVSYYLENIIPDCDENNNYSISFNFNTNNENSILYTSKNIPAFEINFTIGTIANVNDYKKIYQIKRKSTYYFIFKYLDKENKPIKLYELYGDERDYWHVALPGFSYKALKDSVYEATTPVGISNAIPYDIELVMDMHEDRSAFIPDDHMTAEEIYHLFIANPKGYNYPLINREVEYISQNNILDNPNYKEKVYPLKKILVNNENGSYNVERVFKSAEEVYNELYIKNNINDTVKSRYDKIPRLIFKPHIETVNESEVIHNFNDITCADIVILDTVKNETDKWLNLLVFLVFKTKLLVFKTKYYYNNPSENESFNTKNCISELNDLNNTLNKDHFINLLPGGGDAIEITTINPVDNTSLHFLNLNAIKIYKNMLYLIDSKLDMVLRYDIGYLLNSNEEHTLTKESLKLLDNLQGFGNSLDKIYFNQPYSIDVSDDYVYIVDRKNKCVKIYSTSLNFIKVVKNGFFSQHDVQAVAINPYPCTINDVKINSNSLWIASVLGDRIFISVLEDDIVKVYGELEDIRLLNDEYSWREEVRSLEFSQVNSNYFYLNTSKRIYKLHVSKPFYPFASLNYFKQRSIVGTMRWTSMRYPWHNLPSIYAGIDSSGMDFLNELTWDYQPPESSAEVLDNKCFCLTSSPEVEGDIIFHFGVLYDMSAIKRHIQKKKSDFSIKDYGFYDISKGELANMIKSSAILLYSEPDSFITSLTNNEMKIYNIYKIDKNIENDYINPLTFNKMIYALVNNLLQLKNTLMGHFRAATNIDNVIVYDNIVLDDYFNNLQLDANENYFIHNNETMSIVVNRTFENIFDIQEKILNKMQTEFMAAQSYVNNTSRMI